jgi:hypothetical protein
MLRLVNSGNIIVRIREEEGGFMVKNWQVQDADEGLVEEEA